MKEVFKIFGIFTISLVVVLFFVMVAVAPILLAWKCQSLWYLLLYCIPIAGIFTFQYINEND